MFDESFRLFSTIFFYCECYWLDSDVDDAVSIHRVYYIYQICLVPFDASFTVVLKNKAQCYIKNAMILV